MMKKILFGALLACFVGNVGATEKQIKSPDGQIVVTVSDADGKPTYSVALGGVTFLEPSPLGLVLDLGDYTTGMSLTDSKEDLKYTDSYTLKNSKQSKIDVEANGGIFTFAKDGKNVYSVEFYVSNRDVVFRYNLMAQRPTFCCVVKQEASGFCLPEGATTFLCPQATPMGGFAGQRGRIAA